jgi:hypothetical protein
MSRTLARWLMDAPLTYHHPRVRRSSDHPAGHARRVLDSAAGALSAALAPARRFWPALRDTCAVRTERGAVGDAR